MARPSPDAMNELAALEAAYRKSLWTIIGHAVFFFVCCAAAVISASSALQSTEPPRDKCAGRASNNRISFAEIITYPVSSNPRRPARPNICKISSPRNICSTASRRYESPASATLRSEKLIPAAKPIVATTTRNCPAFASGSITPALAA